MHLWPWTTASHKSPLKSNSISRSQSQRPRHTPVTPGSRPQNTSFFSMTRSPMFSVFNIVRAGIYVIVLLWSIICLAITIHFHTLLTTNDLTRFIPFAIFVCSATLAIITALLLFGLRKANPISTRIELGCLGLAGIIWLVLAAFLFSSNAQNADVECYSISSNVSGPVDVPGFTTQSYQAQYRVLEAFSLFNVILLWGFLLFLLFLTLRHNSYGDRQVWFAPVTSYSWFYRYQPQEKESKLPPPVTAPVDRTRSKGGGALTAVPEKSRDRRARVQRETSQDRTPQQQQPRYGYKHGYWLPVEPPTVPQKTSHDAGRPRPSRSNTRDKHDRRHDRYQRDASPRR